MSYQLNLTFGYSGTDFTRDYALEVDDSITSAAIVTAVKSVNNSLTGGTSGGLDEFFIADDYDGTNGKLSKILKAETNSDSENIIYPGGE